MIINNKFELGSIVYLITDPDQFERMITRIIITMNGAIIYEASCGNCTSLHYDGEMSTKKNIQITLGIEKEV